MAWNRLSWRKEPCAIRFFGGESGNGFDERFERVALTLVGRMRGVVPWSESADVWIVPYLQEVHIFLTSTCAVLFTVTDACPRRGELNVTTFEHLGIAHGVLVGQLAVQHDAEDLRFSMRVCAKARPCSHAVLVDHAQIRERHVSWIVVRSERKCVEGLEPSMVCMSALEPPTWKNAQLRCCRSGHCFTNVRAMEEAKASLYALEEISAQEAGYILLTDPGARNLSNADTRALTPFKQLKMNFLR